MHTVGAPSNNCHSHLSPSPPPSPSSFSSSSSSSSAASASFALPLSVSVQSPLPAASLHDQWHSSIPSVTRRKEVSLVPSSTPSTASTTAAQLTHFSPSHSQTLSHTQIAPAFQSLPAFPSLPSQSTLASSSSSSSSSMSTPINERAKEKQSVEYALKSLIAGATAGATAKTAVAPLDRVKILFQAHNPNVAKFRGHLLGVFEALREIVKQDGILGAYRGHSAILTRIMPYAGLNYMFYEQYKRLLLPVDPNDHGHFQRILSGSLAGATAVFFTYPLDLVHSRMAYQIKSRKYTSISQTIEKTFEEEGGVLRGIRALYRGFGPTMLGILPYAGVSFSTYDTLKTTWLKEKVLRHKRANEPTEAGQPAHTVDANDLHRYSSAVQLSVYEKLSFGALAGACAQTVSYPLDVVRRRMQVKGLSNEFHYKSTVDGLRTILRVEGWRGLFVGLSINYLKVAPSHAVSFLAYEYMKQLLGIH